MKTRSRRDFVKLCLTSVPAVGLAQQHPDVPSPSPKRTPKSIDRWLDPLPILPRLQPIGHRQQTTLYRVRMREFQRRLHSQLPPTRLWGYEGQYPGPIIEAFHGRPVEVRWENQLPLKHLFPVDPHIHGAMAPTPTVRTVPHLHGSSTSSEYDGLPEHWFTPGKSAVYRYPNNQRAATLWYHDHAVGSTRLNVYAGLSAFYLLRDAEEQGMNLPSGEYEVPLMLQDRTLNDQAQLVYNPTNEDGKELPPGVWGPEFFGELPVVNGALYPYLDVEPRLYRFRLLNSANSRFLQLYFNLASSPTDVPSLVGFHQIGSDGGLLAAPVPLETLVLSPGERADLVLDFSGLEGKTITLSNKAAAPYPGWDMLMNLHAPLSEWMQFRVRLPLKAASRKASLPSPVSLPRLAAKDAVLTRDFVLAERTDDQGHSLGVRIDNKGYDDPVSEFPQLGSMEIWRFINTTDDAHPMHLHLVQFQIAERQGFNLAKFTTGKLEFVGTSRPPAANEAGWKDTAIVAPHEILSILVPFQGYTGRFVFHCHMLEHEDNDMMRPFEVVASPHHP